MNKELATLLRAAAKQTISESDFWERLKWLSDPHCDPIAAIAYETATHYWGNFHSRNLLLIKVKPDPYQLQQGQDELNLIADGLEANWPLVEFERRLNDI
jgi:hypothetical protein